MKQINWGIIGTGSIASAFAHSIEHCSHSKLSGVYGRNAEALNVFSKKFKVEPFKDIESFLDASDIDAVMLQPRTILISNIHLRPLKIISMFYVKNL